MTSTSDTSRTSASPIVTSVFTSASSPHVAGRRVRRRAVSRRPPHLAPASRIAASPRRRAAVRRTLRRRTMPGATVHVGLLAGHVDRRRRAAGGRYRQRRTTRARREATAARRPRAWRRTSPGPVNDATCVSPSAMTGSGRLSIARVEQRRALDQRHLGHAAPKHFAVHAHRRARDGARDADADVRARRAPRHRRACRRRTGCASPRSSSRS